MLNRNLYPVVKKSINWIPLGLLLVFQPGCGPVPQGNPVESWPSKPITISCYAAAGGGTDTVSRLLAKTLEAELGVSINVVNRAASRGGAAINYVSSRKPDGYNWLGISESMLPASVLGVTGKIARDWTFFMVAGAPGVISVGEKSPYRSLADLIEAARKSPGSIKVSASLTGGIWHTKLLALQSATDVEFSFIPFNKGSQPSQLAALSGEVDAVLTSISEQAELIKSGRLRPLAMVEMNPFDFPEIGEIPAAGVDYPDIRKLPVTQFLGIALPAETPSEILQKITAGFEKIMQSDEISTYCQQRFLALQGKHGTEADQFARNVESAWCWKLQEIGIAVKSPEVLGIPKPE